MDKNVDDFIKVAKQLEAEGQDSRAKAVMYLIERVKQAQHATTVFKEALSRTVKNSEEMQQTITILKDTLAKIAKTNESLGAPTWRECLDCGEEFHPKRWDNMFCQDCLD
jgi:RNA polymerase-binding transcription factor DksA